MKEKKPYNLFHLGQVHSLAKVLFTIATPVQQLHYCCASIAAALQHLAARNAAEGDPKHCQSNNDLIIA